MDHSATCWLEDNSSTYSVVLVTLADHTWPINWLRLYLKITLIVKCFGQFCVLMWNKTHSGSCCCSLTPDLVPDHVWIFDKRMKPTRKHRLSRCELRTSITDSNPSPCPCPRVCVSECSPCPRVSVQKCVCGREKAERPCASPQWNCQQVKPHWHTVILHFTAVYCGSRWNCTGSQWSTVDHCA